MAYSPDFRDLVMSDVMAEFHDGPHATPSPSETGPIYLGIKNITEDGFLDLSSVRRIAADDFAMWTKRVVPQAGDVVFTYEATLHRYALIPRGFNGCLGRRLALIRPRTSVVDPKFLHLMLLSPEWRQTVENRVIAGATVERIPLVDFPNFPISLPSLAQQRRIAAALSAFDELIEINERRIELLEDLARSLYREWFVRLRFPGYEDLELVDSELGPIPEGWRVRPLGEVCSLVKAGSTPKRSVTKNWHGTIPWFKTGELQDGPLLDSAEHVTPSAGARLFDPPAILLAIYGSPTVGRLGWLTRTASCNQAALALVAEDPAAQQDWLWAQLNALRGHFNSMSQGAAQQNVSKEKVVGTRVAVPPGNVLRAYGLLVSPMRERAHILVAMNRSLAKIRDLLLPRLVTGRLDISDVDLGALEPTEPV